MEALPAGDVLKTSELMWRFGLTHRSMFTSNYLKAALAAGLIEMKDPDSPRSNIVGCDRAGWPLGAGVQDRKSIADRQRRWRQLAMGLELTEELMQLNT